VSAPSTASGSARELLAGKCDGPRTRHDFFACDRHPHQQLCSASRVVAGATGFHVARNKAVVGQNAFAHESGIHSTDDQPRATYEVMRREDVWLQDTTLVLAAQRRHRSPRGLRDLGYQLEPSRVDRVFES